MNDQAGAAPDPLDPDDLYEQGLAHYRQRHWREAQECFRRVQEAEPGRRGVEALLRELEMFISLEGTEELPPPLPEPTRSARRWRGGGTILVTVLVVVAAVLLVRYVQRRWPFTAPDAEIEMLRNQCQGRSSSAQPCEAIAPCAGLATRKPGDPWASYWLGRATENCANASLCEARRLLQQVAEEITPARKAALGEPQYLVTPEMIAQVAQAEERAALALRLRPGDQEATQLVALAKRLAAGLAPYAARSWAACFPPLRELTTGELPRPRSACAATIASVPEKAALLLCDATTQLGDAQQRQGQGQAAAQSYQAALEVKGCAPAPLRTRLQALTPTATPTFTPTATPTATSTPVPTATDTPTLLPSETPLPTLAPTATPSPTPTRANPPPPPPPPPPTSPPPPTEKPPAH